MIQLTLLWRKVRLTSNLDLLVLGLGLLAKFYIVGFTLYLSVAKIRNPAAPIKLLWVIPYAVALFVVAVIPFLPKNSKKRWERAETTRLQATNVAISRLTSCIRAARCTEVDFKDVTRRLLTAIRQETENMVADAESIYINATLMVEDEIRSDCLRVVNRANADRPDSLYLKASLFVWEAMQNRKAKYVSEYDSPGKEYHCILALPILIEEDDGSSSSVGVVSIDSGRAHDFDGIDERLAIRLLPYLSLLKLALSIRAQWR